MFKDKENTLTSKFTIASNGTTHNIRLTDRFASLQNMCETYPMLPTLRIDLDFVVFVAPHIPVVRETQTLYIQIPLSSPEKSVDKGPLWIFCQLPCTWKMLNFTFLE